MNIHTVLLAAYLGFYTMISWFGYRCRPGNRLTVFATIAGASAAIGFLALPLTDKPTPPAWIAVLAATLRSWVALTGFPLSEGAALGVLGATALFPLLIVAARLVPPSSQAGSPPAS